MSGYLSNSLETKMAFKLDHMFVFTTDITMHERFTFKHPRCVFIYNNGYTSSFKNNDVKGRIVFPNQKMRRNEMYFEEDNFEKKLNRLASKRRSVLMPPKIESKNNSTDFIDDEDLGHSDLRFNSFLSSTPKPGLKFGRYNFIGRRFNRWNERPKRSFFSSSFYLPGRYRYIQKFPYKWRPRRVSKAQLDDEIDEYMAEVRQKSACLSNDEKNSTYNEECLREAEKYLLQNGCDL